MASRLQLHEELGLFTENRYFNPPESVEMIYDCIRYKRVGVEKLIANNKMYHGTNEYELIVISDDPDCEIPDKLMAHFPMCSFVRFYPADGLNHFVLRLYY